ncbi:MAG: ABC transporter permease [Oscillospiraceae bacterium]|nr:ABC transporter permease [Oscillospiraceae bacterium]
MTGFLNALPGAISQGLIWGIMALGLYITFKVLELSDLTVDGSLCTGGAVCVMMMVNGANVWLAMLVATLAGAATGAVTGFFHTKCKIPAILSGILTQFGLWSVNLAIMDMNPTVRVDAEKFGALVSSNFVNEVKKGRMAFYKHPIFVVALLIIALIAVMYWFFGTEKGASIRATGTNAHMARAQGINTDANKMVGLMLSNGLVALAGALLCQYNGFTEIAMGRGAIVIGLAAIVIGDVLFAKLFRNFALKLAAVAIGAVVYQVVVQFVVSVLDINTNYMKLFTALIIAVFLTIPNFQGKIFKKSRKERSHA